MNSGLEIYKIFYLVRGPFARITRGEAWSGTLTGRGTMACLPRFAFTAFACIFVICRPGLITGQIRYSIPEEMKQGAFVANIAVDLGLNVRQLSARKFRLGSDDGGRYMKVSLDNGIMSIRERIDRERICGQTDKCTIPFETILANPLEMYHGELVILDVNDNSPTFPQSSIVLQISEASAPGVHFRLEGADDPDIGTNTVAAYTISSSEYFSLKTQRAEDGIIIAELLLEKLLDREQQSSLQLLLTGMDGGTPQRSATAQILITVLDFNDNPPVFDHNIYRGSVSENALRGTLVLKIQANDLDEGLNAELTYRLHDATLRRVQHLFSLDPRTGEILVKGPLDFEEVNSYSLDIQAQDHGSPAMTGHCKVVIKVIDANDNAPEIRVTSASNKIQEDTPPGSFISLIYVIDRDSETNGQVRCEIQKNVPFRLQKTSNHYKLVTSETLDREAISEYNILVSAWDLGSPSLSTNKTIEISISDINDNAPQFSETSHNVYVMENNAAGASVSTVTAMDPDLDLNSHVSYSFLDNHIQNLPVSTYLTINTINGTIYALRPFDYEELKNFQIHVQARDAGVPRLSSSATMNVIILDQNDNAPVIVSPSEQSGPATVEVVPETAGQGYLVTKIIANDADSGQNARLFYQMMKSTATGLYNIGQHSGEVRTARNILQSDNALQTLVILVKDNGQPSLSSTVGINIRLLWNSTEGISESSTLVKNPEYFSDPNVYLIVIFSCTSVVFLLIIILLIGIKCKQDRHSIQEYNSPSYSHNYGGSHGTFSGRPALEETLRYPGTGRVLRVQEPNQYSVCLSPESAKTDFLFLKPCGAPTSQAQC
ncbi:protocadherin gamma-C5-like [Leucoraja erinacea]|uniref:protocadherin gamma-C5-like n=1 Tax=Leucoraja erinaceus TaxID=7782 RepID=UPI002457E474|nr:protocadherin gamma-C5-like [Leucoraja erinacea]